MNMEGLPGRTSRKPWLNGVLFVLTFASTFFVGLGLSLPYIFADTFRGGPGVIEVDWDFQAFLDPRVLALGLLYAGVLMVILTGHELGHYLTCRRYGLAATLPYFLPAPNLFGTLGAFIKIKSPINWKRQLFDVGAAGPLTGFILSLPALAIGLAFSKVVPGALSGGTLELGEPLLLKLGSALHFGRIPAGSDIFLHPVAFAGWVGLLVTSINLLPVGQLDGGHVAYALVGRQRKLVSSLTLGALILLGVFFFVGWLIWGGLGLLFVLVVRLKRPGFLYRLASRLRHPQILDEDVPLDRGRMIVGALVILIFILSFIPDPIKGMSLLGLLKQAGLGVK
jgi:membrane-associated protease RseP (regulator of RpoE activity)